MTFAPFDKQAAILAAPYLASQTNRFCDLTVGVNYLWQEHYHCHYAFVSGCLVLQVQYGNDIYYTYPLGSGNAHVALGLLEQTCMQRELPLQFACCSTAQVDDLRRRYGEIKVLSQRDYYDYLYLYTDLATFAGRRYSGQRNHINQFIKRWPQWCYQPLSRESIPAVKTFLREINRRKAQEGVLLPDEVAEEKGCGRLLDAMHELADGGIALTGGMLTVDGQIVAFSIGEQVGDTLYVHVEKGDTRYHGVYQLMVREYAAHNGGDGIHYINREDDTGDEGLRRSKLSYRPHALLEKSLVIIEG